MKPDLLVKIGADDPSFELSLLELDHDGSVQSGRRKRFNEPFQAKKLEGWIRDWKSWRILTAPELEEVRRIRAKSAPIEGPPHAAS